MNASTMLVISLGVSLVMIVVYQLAFYKQNAI